MLQTISGYSSVADSKCTVPHLFVVLVTSCTPPFQSNAPSTGTFTMGFPPSSSTFTSKLAMVFGSSGFEPQRVLTARQKRMAGCFMAFTRMALLSQSVA